MTCNLHACWANQDALLRLIRYYRVDVAVYQESRYEDIRPPKGWHVENRRTLTILSRWPIRDVRGRHCHKPCTPWPHVDCLAATIDTDHGPVDVATVHFRTPRWGLEEVLDRHTIIDPARSDRLTDELYYRNLESSDAREWISKNCKAPTVIAGDFNLVPDGRIYQRHWGDLQNAFSAAGFGFGYTRWTTLPLGLRYGARIDHILCDQGMTATDAIVAPTVGSDHLPVIASLEIAPRKETDALAAILKNADNCLCLRDCVVDGTFDQLGKKPGLTTVAIENSATTKQGIRAIASLPDLENLYLESSSPINSEQIQMIAEIPRLSNLALLGLQAEADLDLLESMAGLEAVVLSAPKNLQPGRTRAKRTQHLITLFGKMDSLTHVLLLPGWAKIVDEAGLKERLPNISLRVLSPINGFRFEDLYRKPQYIQKETDAERPLQN